MVEEPEMPLFPVLKAGVQGAVAPCRGLGCPQILLFPLSPPAAASKKREKGYLGTLGVGDPQTPAGRARTPGFGNFFKSSG